MRRSTRRRVAWLLSLGLLTAAAVVAAGFALRMTRDGGGGGDAAGVEIPAMIAPIGSPGPVPAERVTVTATSFLPPDGSITYGPANIVDDDLTTAWNSDVPDGDGRGQQVTFRFTTPVDLTAIQFVNGYAKSPEIFAANHRIRELRIQTDASTQLVTLLDTTDPQEISFDFGVTSKVVLEVLEVFAGEGFENPDLTADLALTEVDFVAVQP